jgi:hypothetical protein
VKRKQPSARCVRCGLPRRRTELRPNGCVVCETAEVARSNRAANKYMQNVIRIHYAGEFRWPQKRRAA